MATTFEKGIDVIRSYKSSTQGQPHEPTKTRILIQAAQTLLAALVSRIPSPLKQMKESLCLDTITNSFGRIHDSINTLESILLASP